jgi:hypothetical protein
VGKQKRKGFVEETAGAENFNLYKCFDYAATDEAFTVFDDECMDYMVENGFELAKAMK